MSDNTTLPTGSGGDTVRTIDRTGIKTQVTQLDFGGEAGPESLVVLANGLPVQPATGSTFAISAASLPLPAGAATGAKQDTGNTSVASIDTKTPALGQALAAASVPVVLTAAQVTTLTPPAAITGFALEAGHLATIDSHIPAQGQALAAASMPVVLPATQITTLTPPAAITGFALEAGNLATLVARQPALGAATTANSSPVTIASDQTVPVSGSFWQTTQPVSAASLPLPTNAAQETGNLLAIANDMHVLHVQYLQSILTELRIMNFNLKNGLNVPDDLDVLRADQFFSTLQ